MDHAAVLDVRRAFAVLTDEEQEIIGLSVFGGYSSREIGAKMNASDGKVRMWMTRAKRFLQTQPEILALMEI